ncbi:MAG: S26 family signal peptidase, partial [Planctomycetota bacterium]|nr:S26 family signal peptidase [Planctomycetota bacterium]
YCLKRVVGLPHERVQIVAGDVWINGQCVKKDWSTLRPMAILIHDASFDAPRRDIPSRWTPVTQVNRWKKRERGFRFSRNPATDVSEGTGWIGYQHFDFVRGVPRERERITDNYAYNQTLSRSLSSMSDLILSARVRSQGGGTLKFRLGTCELQLDASSQRGLLLHENRPVAQCVWDGKRISRDTRLEIAVVDRQFFFVIEDEVLLRYDLDKSNLDKSDLDESLGSADHQEGANPAGDAMSLDPRWYLAIGAKNLDLDVTEVQILRDVYYTDQIVGVARTRRGECQLGEGQFFVLGDNSPLSLDSRREGAGSLMERADIRGRAVWWQ